MTTSKGRSKGMHRLRRNGKGRGMSLMEIMVVLGIMTIVLVMVSQIFSVSYDIFVKDTARAENDTGAILATRAISEATRGADQVLDSATINGTTYTASDSTLVLELPAIDSSYNIISGVYDDVAIYRDTTNTDEIWSDTQDGTGSQRPSGKKRLTADNVALVFRYNATDPANADRVSVLLSNSQTVRGETYTTNTWTSIFIRNK